MVDVGAKEVTLRTALAEARMRLPRVVAHALRASGQRTKKGPVFDTAIIAGVMAAKRTHELIPFCHPLGIENCQIEIAPAAGDPYHHPLPGERASPYGRGDGGAHRRHRRCAHPLRHVQGALARS